MSVICFERKESGKVPAVLLALCATVGLGLVATADTAAETRHEMDDEKKKKESLLIMPKFLLKMKLAVLI